jgi:spore germination cell wall hydrolase CwlJ-like protein
VATQHQVKGELVKIRFLLAAFIFASFCIPALVLYFEYKTVGAAEVERVSVSGKVTNSPEYQKYLDTKQKELECLAINIYKEAGYEPLKGQLAVAQVTLNRVEHREFPNSICEVVYQKRRNPNTGRIVCQFSWYCDPVHRTRNIHEASYQRSYDIARQALIDGARIVGLEDALFYHATYVSPGWRLERVTKIGQHIFYQLPESRRLILASR